MKRFLMYKSWADLKPLVESVDSAPKYRTDARQLANTEFIFYNEKNDKDNYFIVAPDTRLITQAWQQTLEEFGYHWKRDSKYNQRQADGFAINDLTIRIQIRDIYSKMYLDAVLDSLYNVRYLKSMGRYLTVTELFENEEWTTMDACISICRKERDDFPLELICPNHIKGLPDEGILQNFYIDCIMPFIRKKLSDEALLRDPTAFLPKDHNSLDKYYIFEKETGFYKILNAYHIFNRREWADGAYKEILEILQTKIHVLSKLSCSYSAIMLLESFVNLLFSPKPLLYINTTGKIKLMIEYIDVFLSEEHDKQYQYLRKVFFKNVLTKYLEIYGNEEYLNILERDLMNFSQCRTISILSSNNDESRYELLADKYGDIIRTLPPLKPESLPFVTIREKSLFEMIKDKYDETFNKLCTCCKGTKYKTSFSNLLKKYKGGD